MQEVGVGEAKRLGEGRVQTFRIPWLAHIIGAFNS